LIACAQRIEQKVGALDRAVQIVHDRAEQLDRAPERTSSPAVDIEAYRAKLADRVARAVDAPAPDTAKTEERLAQRPAVEETPDARRERLLAERLANRPAVEEDPDARRERLLAERLAHRSEPEISDPRPAPNPDAERTWEVTERPDGRLEMLDSLTQERYLVTIDENGESVVEPLLEADRRREADDLGPELEL